MAMGGWDCKFMDEPPDDLICLVCTFAARDPQQVTCCGRIFCKSCLAQLRKCPNCSGVVNSFPDGRSDRHVRELRVHCTGYGVGCYWTGELRYLEAHSRTCVFQVVPCPNHCSDLVYRSNLATHTESHCTRRRYQCPHCRLFGTYRAITSAHLQECPQVVVSCPNACKTGSITRAQLSNHLEVCPNEEVVCLFSEVGCGTALKRCNHSTHETEDCTQHLQQVLQVLKSVRKNVVQMKRQLKQKSPVAVFKIPKFNQLKSEEKDWTSDAFYSHSRGYKLCLNVEANGYGTAKGSHISIFIYIMKGEYDGNLPWPCKAQVCVELLNQVADEGHHSYMIDFEEEEATRVQTGETGTNGYGPCSFIAHDNLRYSITTNTQYLNDDCLFFRIYSACDAVYKPWLKEFNSSDP